MITLHDIRLAIVLPAYNEATGIVPTLDSLRDQNDTDFDVVFVDNNSTDGTVDVLNNYIQKHELNRWMVIVEPEKGTGAAADTGIRCAIGNGATHVARTDTDCVASKDWVSKIKEKFIEGNLFVAGRITPRQDEFDLPKWQYKTLDSAVIVASLFGKVRPSNRGSQYKGPYIMTAGCNVAIESALYLECGGFPRTKIEDVHEDRVLINNVRRVTKSYVYAKDVVVYTSSRRVKEWGLWNTLMWYKDHSYKPEVIDIR